MRKNMLLLITPFLLTAYPILYLASDNINLIDITDIIRSIVVSLLLVSIVLLLSSVLFRNMQKAIFLTSVLAFLFFSYGHVYNVIREFQRDDRILRNNQADINPGLVKTLALIWIGIFVVALLVLWKRSRWLPAINRYVRLVSSLLIVAALGSMMFSEMTVTASDDDYWETMPADVEMNVIDPDSLPDIYYIILDAYSNHSVMQELYNFDNSPFLSALEQRGFYVATESRANFPKTPLSLASSLNMSELEFLRGKGGTGYGITYDLASNNRVARILERAGYTIITFPTVYKITEHMEVADISYDYGIPILNQDVGLNQFEYLFIHTTALRGFTKELFNRNSQAPTEYTFDQLYEIAHMSEPTFTFAHMILPHSPFVFSADDAPPNPGGTPVDGLFMGDFTDLYNDTEEVAVYLDQLNYANRAVTALVDEIIAESDQPPVIIIQSDHGYWVSPFPESWAVDEVYDYIFPILNAYYLPDDAMDELYPSISPVNTFRLVLDYYLGTDFGLIEDRHYMPSEVPDSGSSNEWFDFSEINGDGILPRK